MGISVRWHDDSRSRAIRAMCAAEAPLLCSAFLHIKTATDTTQKSQCSKGSRHVWLHYCADAVTLTSLRIASASHWIFRSKDEKRKYLESNQKKKTSEEKDEKEINWFCRRKRCRGHAVRRPFIPSIERVNSSACLAVMRAPASVSVSVRCEPREIKCI